MSAARNPRKFIAIAGNIGSGKSSLLEFLSATYRAEPFYEPNDENPYLADFYRDMKRWAFQSQLFFLSNKFRIHQQADRVPGLVIQDRTIFEDAEIFATALYQMRKISKRDWETYQGFYGAILDAIRPPDLMIYLRCSMRTLRQRIRIRGRKMEKDVPLAYLKRLERLYDDWIASYSMSEVLVRRAAAGAAVVFSSHQLDLVAVTGDIADHGRPGQYRRAAG